MNFALIDSVPSSLQTLISGVGEMIDFGGTILDKAISNPILLGFMAAGFVGVGVAVIGKLLGLSRSVG